jgi:hypothetical protein
MTYFALNVQRCLVPDDQLQVLVLVPEDQQALVLVPDDQVLVLVPDDHQALLLVPDDQQGLVLHKKTGKRQMLWSKDKLYCHMQIITCANVDMVSY